MPSVTTQPITAQLTHSAIFLVVTLKQDGRERDLVRALCGDMPALLRGIGFRHPDRRLSCVVGFGSDAWDRIFGAPRPAELHPFREIKGVHHAV